MGRERRVRALTRMMVIEERKRERKREKKEREREREREREDMCVRVSE